MKELLSLHTSTHDNIQWCHRRYCHRRHHRYYQFVFLLGTTIHYAIFILQLVSQVVDAASLLPTDAETLKSLGMDDGDYQSVLGGNGDASTTQETSNPLFLDEDEIEDGIESYDMYDEIYDEYGEYDEYDVYDDELSSEEEDMDEIEQINEIDQELGINKEYFDENEEIISSVNTPSTSKPEMNERKHSDDSTTLHAKEGETSIAKGDTEYTNTSRMDIETDYSTSGSVIDEEDSGENESPVFLEKNEIVDVRKQKESLINNSIPAMILANLGKSLISSPTSMQVIVSLIGGNFMFRWIGELIRKSSSQIEEEESNEISNELRSADDIDELDILEEDESSYVNDFGFGRPRPAPRESSYKAQQGMSNEQDSIADDDKDKVETDTSTQMNKDSFGKKILPWRKDAKYNQQSPQNPIKHERERIGLFGRRKHIKDQLKNVHQMGLDIGVLRERAEAAEMIRDGLQKSGEKAMMQFQESQKQLDELNRVNIYLKAQLRDNKRILERAVNAERQKTNEELRRVRDSMVAVLEQERRIMRAQIMKTSAEVRSMLEENETDIDDDFEQYETQRV